MRFESAGYDHAPQDEPFTPLHEIFHANLYGVDAIRTADCTDTSGYTTEQEQPDMSTLDEAIKQLLAIEGATGAAVVDYSSGMALAQGGNPGFDLGVAAAGNSNVVSAKLRTMADLSIDSDIDDILITLGTQYHLINVLNSSGSRGLFVYLVLDRTYANLALARHKLKNLAKDITI
ncbi:MULTISPECIES: hypothetical protein [Micrococcaceae]|uniref:hypothetical protein n=1 Tax=Micrococcaceae TaxID=1268 RepID=UPI001EE15D4B|nr:MULTISPECIES: hypothetical protein [Micrococcaceae]MBP2265760.1 hypothetical protein [Pseudarthrobacter sp. PvP004]